MIDISGAVSGCKTKEEKVAVLKGLLEDHDRKIAQEHNDCVRFKGKYMTTINTDRSSRLKTERASIFRRLEVLTGGKWLGYE